MRTQKPILFIKQHCTSYATRIEEKTPEEDWRSRNQTQCTYSLQPQNSDSQGAGGNVERKEENKRNEKRPRRKCCCNSNKTPGEEEEQQPPTNREYLTCLLLRNRIHRQDSGKMAKGRGNPWVSDSYKKKKLQLYFTENAKQQNQRQNTPGPRQCNIERENGESTSAKREKGRKEEMDDGYPRELVLHVLRCVQRSVCPSVVSHSPLPEIQFCSLSLLPSGLSP